MTVLADPDDTRVANVRFALDTMRGVELDDMAGHLGWSGWDARPVDRVKRHRLLGFFLLINTPVELLARD